ncbi:MAG: peptide-N4-asparagine amidase, partial [Mycobacteriales bacterium]
VLVAATTALLAVTAVTAQAATVPPPPLPTLQQESADPPVTGPATTTCSETIMAHDFAASYGQPYNGTYTPSVGCPGPWAKVVLTFTGTVAGVQFDRMLDVFVGNTEFLRGSTSEPCCFGNAITWTVQRDVTQYSSLLTSPQPVTVHLDNVYNSTYNGIYHTTAVLTFYQAGPGAPAAAVPDVVLPVSSTGTDGPGAATFTLGRVGQTAGSAITFPENLVRLHAELFADGHGACEEFWWGDPENCAGTPYREVAIYLDGQLAGAAPVYPTTFTGADGPGLWEPIPSPRAWDLRPYVVDLTPFVGLLTDGAPHEVTLGVLDASYQPGDYWPVTANLLGWTSSNEGRTQGALVSASAPATPTDVLGTDPTGQGVEDTDNASHALSFTGWVRDGDLVRTTTVTEAMSANDTQTPTTVDTTWDWRQATSTATSGPSGTTRTEVDSNSSYAIDNVVLTHFGFSDANTTTASTNGTQTAWSSFAETMSTSAVGLAANGAEKETYQLGDSTGTCYDKTLVAAGGLVVDTLNGSACPTVPTG